MPKSKVVKLGDSRIYREPDGGFRAVIPRFHGGGRARRRFPSEAAARAWIAANAPAIAIREPLAAAEAADYRQAASILPPGASMTDAARALASSSTAVSDRQVRDAVSEFLSAKQSAGRRQDTIRDYTSALSRLPSCALSELSAASVSSSIADLNPRRRNNVLATFRTFFRWAIASRYLAADPSAPIDKAAIDWTPPRIYTPAQTLILFRVAEEIAPRIVPFMALCAFGGLRISGALRLSKDSIDRKGNVVYVPGYADKLRRSYIVDTNDTLSAWLDAYPFHPWKSSRQSYHVAFDKLVHKTHIPPIRNGLRHSFASYLYAKTQDVRAVASALGHLGEVETLLRSYRRIISPALADAYFSIRPSR